MVDNDEDRLFLFKEATEKMGYLFILIRLQKWLMRAVLMDEIFGRINYLNTICLTTNDPSSLKPLAENIFYCLTTCWFYTREEQKNL